MWFAVAVSILLLVAGPTRVRADEPGHAPQWAPLTPATIQWREGPPSMLPGAKMAILEGDPAKEGFFTMRLKVPDGYRVLPHWHPNTERLTIIQGIVHLGTGDRFDAGATRALPAGTYSSMPPHMTHFAWMEGETILQLSSLGPWEVIYVNPADDPRASAKPPR
jgi:hypothetical protein